MIRFIIFRWKTLTAALMINQRKEGRKLVKGL